ncbi:G-box-binding factor 4-like [Impatiens glandulifera]|uniref:G-box-binding factor 4-like n=1 Tax=Impatiens glandulifera TaxID=253017 RepID=UPI001FB14374|nr:G-box-binding factor 4-like [Impatiens glandulifera]
MASSKVVTSSTSKNPDRRRKSSNATKSSSISDLHTNHIQFKNDIVGHNDLSTTVDGLLRNLYGGGATTAVSTLLDAEITLLDAAVAPGASDNEGSSSGGGMPIIRRQESSNFPRKTVQDILKEIVAGRSERRECKQEAPDEFMTLEDFLTKADALDNEDVKIEPRPLATERLSEGLFTFDSLPMNADGAIGFGSGEVNGVRGKRRAAFEPLDKASQQRQRRMIKNRESAARSRERKQAYQVELESMAVKLEEENEKLMKEEGEQTRKRLKQLMENIIPVVEKRKPARVLRRVCSMEW